MSSNFYVDIPEETLLRMWDVVRAVAAGYGPGVLQAEAIHLKQEVDRLLDPVVELEPDIEEGDENARMD